MGKYIIGFSILWINFRVSSNERRREVGFLVDKRGNMIR